MLDRKTLEAAMRRALELALRAPAADQNPQVGCVILGPAGETVAEGWHRGAGTPHAETDALSKLPPEWREQAASLTAVVTLEPCNHTGRTGPCAVALVDAGIGSVAFSVEDPSPAAGGGASTLRSARVAVEGGVLQAEGAALLAPWIARTFGRADEPTASSAAPVTHAALPTARPHVIVKWAQTLDGRAAAADGTSQWITGPAARADVHRRRAEADAILVGTGTLLADDPTLTARTEDGALLVPAESQPVPVVFGTREVPETARIRKHPALAARGLDAPLHFAGDDLAGHLAALSALDVRSVFVEGGPTVASALLAAGLVDEVLVYVAPALLGGPRLALGDLGIASMSGIARLRQPRITQLGEDILIQAYTNENGQGS